ncbi:MAG TPA: T9SS type A sorting domain-containing protein [Ignavibacteria bacterium]
MKTLKYILFFIFTIFNFEIYSQNNFQEYQINNIVTDPIDVISDMCFVNMNTGYITAVKFNSGTDGYVFKTTNTGLNWVSKNEGLMSLRLTAMYTFGNYVYLGTNPYDYSREILRRPVSEMVPVIENNAILPKDYKLFQNYPNPFNPATTIKYLINKKCFVNLSLYNINGEIVKELTNKEQKPGSYEINCTFDNQSSGIYYYALKINYVVVDSKKMVYLK